MLIHFLFAMTMSLAPVAEHRVQHADTQKELLQFATTTQQSHQHFASVWPGFWSEHTPFIVYTHEGQAVLFTTNEPVPGYQQLADNYFYYAERLPNLTDFHFHIHYTLPDGQFATAVRLSRDGGTAHDIRETLLHEAFHGYQRTLFADVGRSEFLDPKHLDEASTRAIFELQFDLAKQAHESRETAHIRDWLSLRVVLSEVIAPRVAEYLGDVERIEGTAQWVGMQASFAEHFPDNVSHSFNNFPELFNTTYAIRTSAYPTGALLTDLLNDFSASDNNWRQAIEQGKTPYELALQVFAISTEEALEQLNDVIAQYNLAEYMARAQATSDLISLADIKASYPYRLDISVNALKNDGPLEDTRLELPMAFSGGEKGFHQLEPNLIFLPNAKTFQLTMQDRVIDVRNAPVLADLRQMERELKYSFWSQSPIITIEALENMNDLALQFGQSSIQSPVGWTLDPRSTDEHLRIIF